jgi:hypothetical protein
VKPVTVSVTVPKSSQEVYEFLEVLANHEVFMDRMFIDWQFSGSERGVGARARARARTLASQAWTEFEITEARSGRIVEEAVSAGGTRRTRGTYRLDDLPDGRTRLSYELAWLEASRLERLGPPVARAFVRRANGMAIRRLAKRLAQC